jgi:hypothetical protein
VEPPLSSFHEVIYPLWHDAAAAESLQTRSGKMVRIVRLAVEAVRTKYQAVEKVFDRGRKPPAGRISPRCCR